MGVEIDRLFRKTQGGDGDGLRGIEEERRGRGGGERGRDGGKDGRREGRDEGLRERKSFDVFPSPERASGRMAYPQLAPAA